MWADWNDLTDSSEQAHDVSCKLTESSKQAHCVSQNVSSLPGVAECPQNEPTKSFNVSSQWVGCELKFFTGILMIVMGSASYLFWSLGSDALLAIWHWASSSINSAQFHTFVDSWGAKKYRYLRCYDNRVLGNRSFRLVATKLRHQSNWDISFSA